MANDDDEFVPNPDQPVHQGKWTPEEEEYVHGLIEEFKAGLLPLAEGTSLRTFLSKMLNCQPMRISKKFVGSNYNGKAPYVRKKNTLPNEEVRSRRAKLQELERKFLAKASPMSAVEGDGNSASGDPPASRQPGISVASLTASTSAGLLAAVGAGPGLNGGLDLFAGRSNSKAAAAGRALLLGGSGLGDSTGLGLKSSSTVAGNVASDAGGTNLAGFSSSELAAELEKRAKSKLQTRASVENFLGSAAELQARASVETLLQNPFGSHSGSRSNLFGTGSRSNLLSGAGSRTNLLNAARNSFHRGTSASNLFNAALQKNSTSNLLNAARNSFHKNSTSNLLNAASVFGRGSSTSNLLQNASFAKGTSASNLLNAMASSGGLAGLRGTKNSTSNLLNAARAAGGSSSAAAAGLRSLLEARAAKGAAGGLSSAGSLADLLERHNSGLDLKSRVSHLLEGPSASQNWARTGSGVGLAGAARGSRTNLSSMRLNMLKNGGDIGAASSVFANATFGDRANSNANRNLGLAALLKEQGMSGAAALAASAKEDASVLDKESFTAEMVEKEAIMQQLRGSEVAGGSSIQDYLVKQQLLRGSVTEEPSASTADANDAELRHMLELKRKFLSQDADGAEQAAKRLR